MRDPAVLVTLKMEYVNITLNNILSIYRSEHNSPGNVPVERNSYYDPVLIRPNRIAQNKLKS